jgi:hypothetical protein
MWWKSANKSNDTNDLAKEATKYNNVEDFIKALESQGKIQYHGSPNKFDEFSYDFLGTQGTSEGKGFYFTNKKDIAKGYQKDNGNLFEAYIDIKKPLSMETITMTRGGLAKFLKSLDPNGEGYLSNFGDATTEGYNRILNEAINSLLSYNENDVDLICDIVNGGAGGNPENIYPILKTTLGYDGIIAQYPNWGKGQTVSVAFNNDQIITKDKLIDYYNKIRAKNNVVG